MDLKLIKYYKYAKQMTFKRAFSKDNIGGAFPKKFGKKD